MVVVLVPDGLPLTISVSIAYSVNKMLKDNILLNKLEGPEKMGSMHEICTSKTGIITKNKMRVSSYWIEGKQYKNY